MNILTAEQLEAYKISLDDVKNAVNLTLDNQQYDRKSDIPKQFLDKIDSICQEIETAGKKCFITESTYSYTIWEEKQNTPIANKNPDNISKGKGAPAKQRKYRGAVIDDNQKEISLPKKSQSKTKTKKTVRKYRGIIIEE